MSCNRFRECCLNDSNTACGYHCILTNDTRSIISVSENGKSYQLNNPGHHKVASYQVDGKMIDDPGQIKCDNLIYVPERDIVIFIELKGTDVTHAVSQINETITFLLPNISDCCLHARIVSSRGAPNIRTEPRYITLNRRVRRYQGSVQISSLIMRENMSDLRP